MSRTDTVPGVPATIPLRPTEPVRTPLGDVAEWLAESLVERRGDLADVVVTGVTISSLRVQPGDLYVAPAGARTHGARFAPDAAAA